MRVVKWGRKRGGGIGNCGRGRGGDGSGDDNGSES